MRNCTQQRGCQFHDTELLYISDPALVRTMVLIIWSEFQCHEENTLPRLQDVSKAWFPHIAIGGAQPQESSAAAAQSRRGVYLLQATAASSRYLRCLQSFGFHISAAYCGSIGGVCGAIWKPGFKCLPLTSKPYPVVLFRARHTSWGSRLVFSRDVEPYSG